MVESLIRELKAFVQDNNHLACSESHINKSDMLRDQKQDIPLNGGADTWLLRRWHQWFVS